MKFTSVSMSENENCERTYASFCIAGEHLNPTKITEELRIEPNIAYAKNDVVKSRTGVQRRSRGLWLVDSENRLQSTSLERHLLYLINKLEPYRDVIQFYVDSNEYHVNFLCCWVSSSGHGGPVLSPDILRRLSGLCEEVSFDFYDYSEDT